MPKRLTIGILLVTLIMFYIVPSFYADIRAMELTVFHYILISAYVFLVVNFYRLAFTDLKDRWK